MQQFTSNLHVHDQDGDRGFVLWTVSFPMFAYILLTIFADN